MSDLEEVKDHLKALFNKLDEKCKDSDGDYWIRWNQITDENGISLDDNIVKIVGWNNRKKFFIDAVQDLEMARACYRLIQRAICYMDIRFKEIVNPALFVGGACHIQGNKNHIRFIITDFKDGASYLESPRKHIIITRKKLTFLANQFPPRKIISKEEKKGNL